MSLHQSMQQCYEDEVRKNKALSEALAKLREENERLRRELDRYSELHRYMERRLAAAEKVVEVARDEEIASIREALAAYDKAKGEG